MFPALADYLVEFDFVHDSIVKTLEGLSHEAVNWSPGPEMNSMAVLVAHMSGAQRAQIHQMIGGETIDRVRDEEFRSVAEDGDALVAFIRGVSEHSRAIIEPMTPEDLDREVQTPQGPRNASWPLFHALQHTAEHMGQLLLTRQLWEQRGG
jgi:uncharacterized damage-inducible protein DinB